MTITGIIGAAFLLIAGPVLAANYTPIHGKLLTVAQGTCSAGQQENCGNQLTACRRTGSTTQSRCCMFWQGCLIQAGCDTSGIRCSN
jgi:hypothetical protein